MQWRGGEAAARKGARARKMSTAELQQLRNAMKKDPKAYLDELSLQVRHFHATVDIFKSKPSKPSPELVDAATLLAHVTPSYPRELASFPLTLLQLLEAHHLLMHGSVRKELAHCLIMMRNCDLLSSVAVNRLFFQMFRCKDKKLRAQMSAHIVSDVKNLNTGKVDNRTNKELQVWVPAPRPPRRIACGANRASCFVG